MKESDESSCILVGGEELFNVLAALQFLFLFSAVLVSQFTLLSPFYVIRVLWVALISSLVFGREVNFVFYRVDLETANGMSLNISIYTLLEVWPFVIVSWCNFQSKQSV